MPAVVRLLLGRDRPAVPRQVAEDLDQDRQQRHARSGAASPAGRRCPGPSPSKLRPFLDRPRPADLGQCQQGQADQQDRHDPAEARADGQTPRASGPQSCLCNWTCNRSGRPVSRIQAASSAGSTRPCAGLDQDRAAVGQPVPADLRDRPVEVAAVADDHLDLVGRLQESEVRPDVRALPRPSRGLQVEDDPDPGVDRVDRRRRRSSPAGRSGPRRPGVPSAEGPPLAGGARRR